LNEENLNILEENSFLNGKNDENTSNISCNLSMNTDLNDLS
jgi:hypothetical protein